MKEVDIAEFAYVYMLMIWECYQLKRKPEF